MTWSHSNRRKVHCGSQGCPLAPLLFILALKSVYWVIQGRGDIRGVPLTSGGELPTSKFRAMLTTQQYTFVIDRQLCLVVKIIDDFAAVLGLQTNRAKSIILEINPCESHLPLDQQTGE